MQARNRVDARRNSAQDRGARNLNLLVLVVITCLVAFILYLVWKSFTVAAPSVFGDTVMQRWDPLMTRFTSDYGLEPLEGLEVGSSLSHQHALGAEAAKGDKDSGDSTIGQLSPERLAIVERGQRLYENAGCAICHGPEGRGGVTNPNYVNGTFPSLDQVAKKLGLEFPEDLDVVVEILGVGVSLDDPSKIDIPESGGIISARYATMANVIINGNLAMPKDPNGLEPIFMPSYKGVLSQSEMNQILASLLVLHPIKEETWDEEEPGL